jgi:spore coat polysaccharide biosynthesis predicted glycosyltransferase SpsG
VTQQPSLVRAMLESDLVVCGAGVTMLEAAALGVPCVALTLADNQRPGRDQLAAARIVAPADGVEQLQDVVARLASSVQERRRLAREGAALIDGFGAFRVAVRVADLAV